MEAARPLMNCTQSLRRSLLLHSFGWTSTQGQIRFQGRGIRFHHSVGVFPDSSAGKESACNEEDLGSIPGLGRSPGEGKGYPLQSSWASLVAQLVKNLPAMRKTWVWSLGWEDPLEKEKATHSSILALRIPWTIWSLGSQRVRHYWENFIFTFKDEKKTHCEHPRKATVCNTFLLSLTPESFSLAIFWKWYWEEPFLRNIAKRKKKCYLPFLIMFEQNHIAHSYLSATIANT